MPSSRSLRSRLGLVPLVAATALIALAGPAGADHCGVVQLGGCEHQPDAEEPEPAPEPSEPQSPRGGDDGEPTPGEPAPPQSAPATSAATELVRLLNQERTARGLAPLELRDDVTRIAQDHSLRMAQAEEIFHNDHYFSAATKDQIGAARRAENVAMSGSAGEAHRRLMDSPPHRANVLDAGLTQVGVAAAADESGYLYFTQAFLVPAEVRGAPTAPVAMAGASNDEPSSPSAAAATGNRTPAVLGLPDEAISRPEGSSGPGVLATVGSLSAPHPVASAAILALAAFALVTAALIRSISGWAVALPASGRAVRS